jgi:calpain-15
VLYDKIEVSDIKQGILGDCYFLSCLSALAERPHRIKEIFITQQVNEAGIYAVQLYINGEKKIVVVDDYFPYDEAKSRWAFSKPSTGNEIWVLILEKAFAKVFGSYSRIEVGDSGEALMPLTGCPVQTVELSKYENKEHLWKFLLWAD